MKNKIESALPKILNDSKVEILPTLLLDRPFVDLTVIPKVGVRCKDNRQILNLLRVYELGKWKINDTEPTKYYHRFTKVADLVVDAGLYNEYYKEGECGYSSEWYYLTKGWSTISTSQFFERQHISRDELEEINEWYRHI